MSNIMSALLARGKGIAPNFAPNPQQVAKEKLATKWKVAFDYITEKLGLPSKPPSNQPSAEYLEGRRLTCLTFHQQTQSTLNQTPMCQRPTFQKILLYRNCITKCGMFGLQTVHTQDSKQLITDVKGAYNISVPHLQQAIIAQEVLYFVKECCSNNWSSNGPLALKIVALCVEHKDYAGFLVDIVGMFASIVHQKFYLFEPKWNPSATYAYWFLLSQAKFVLHHVIGSKATVAQMVEMAWLFG
ncbi:hypothetical protein BCR33DRAFT_736220 [Rhizoclosmatium globosum]|uniref:Uncharacterized protein n=1 Tax=Rhizoclosmatium globosum TaxID=329046 RepID=A0A1Y2CK69_9FUNG|nr:hypothetical protein BCR33DRAFT_736220 [Rhizoclosmatium globosum]|eukprot:ORY47409.1 hypothetical protein BCR33DRAFT_736220 [Rhizoclosmatium globosum]